MSGEFLLELLWPRSTEIFFTKKFFFHKKFIQYVATQQGFILRTTAFLPPVLCEGLWVVGDEKRASPAATAQQNPWKWRMLPFAPNATFWKRSFLKGELRIAAASPNCTCVSWCHGGCLRADTAPRLTPACLWAVKDFSFPTMKRASHKSREALLLISWSGKNGQSPSKSDYKARIWKYSECPSCVPPKIGQCSLPLGDALKRCS